MNASGNFFPRRRRKGSGTAGNCFPRRRKGALFMAALLGSALAGAVFPAPAAADVSPREPADRPELTLVQEPVFLPPSYYVGDRVEMRLNIRKAEGRRVFVPEAFPDPDWVDFLGAEITPRGEVYQLRIIFVPYAPGTRTLPALVFGDVILGSLRIHTSSIVQEKGLDFAEPKGQISLPGTTLILALITGGLLLGPVLVLSLSGTFKRKITLVLVTRRGRKPIRRLNRVLKELEEGKTKVGNRRFYLTLSEELRRYLTGRTGRDFLTVTSSEIGNNFLSFLPEAELGTELESMMRQADTIKFGGVAASIQKKAKDIEITRKVTAAVEGRMEQRQLRRYSGKRRIP